MIQVQKKAVFTGHKDCIYALGMEADPHIFYTGGADGLIARWDLRQPDLGELVAKIQHTCYALCYIAERHWIVVGENFDGLHVIDLHTKQEIGSVKLTTAAIFDIRFHAGRLYVGTGDGTLVILDLDSLAVIRYVRASEAAVRCLAISAVHGHVAAGYSDAGIRVFDLQTLAPVAYMQAHTLSVFALAYSPEGRYLLSGSRDAHLRVWDIDSGYAAAQDIVAHMYTINHIAYSPDGKYFATCSKDKSIKLWEAESFRLLKVIDRARHAGHGTSVNKVGWMGQEGYQLVSCSDDRSISVWEIAFETAAV